MYARRPHRWVLWLLPLFALRALVPVGFMVTLSEDGIAVILCSGSTSVPVPAPSDPHAHHAMHGSAERASAEHASAEHAGHGAAAGSESHELAPCPFALMGAGCSIDIARFALDVPPRLGAVSFLSDPALVRAPVLLDRIRGPPARA